MNSLLERQLRKRLQGREVKDPGWPALLEDLSAAYDAFEADQKFVRSTLEVMSRE